MQYETPSSNLLKLNKYGGKMKERAIILWLEFII